MLIAAYQTAMTAALDPANYAFSVYAVPTFATTAAILFLGLFVLIRERCSRISLAFLLVTLSIGMWLFAVSWMFCATDERLGLWWAKAAHLGGTQSRRTRPALPRATETSTERCCCSGWTARAGDLFSRRLSTAGGRHH